MLLNEGDGRDNLVVYAGTSVFLNPSTIGPQENIRTYQSFTPCIPPAAPFPVTIIRQINGDCATIRADAPFMEGCPGVDIEISLCPGHLEIGFVCGMNTRRPPEFHVLASSRDGQPLSRTEHGCVQGDSIEITPFQKYPFTYYNVLYYSKGPSVIIDLFHETKKFRLWVGG